jgi:NTP pyrophosphatase (non-canonical NTP hydrolase)
MKQADLYKAAIDKYGKAHQMTVAIEELAELTKELTKALRGKGNDRNICDEIADVEIVVAELKLMIPNSQKQVQLFKQFKLKRLQLLYIEGEEK